MRQSSSRCGRAAISLCLAGILSTTHAVAASEETSPPDTSGEEELRTYLFGDTLEVRGRFDRLNGIAATSSEGRIGRVDFELRPLLREGELLETVPGLITTQHSGDGKSNQMFLRGFNLDHGTDFRTVLDGMPVNLPTHGHGHGYTDLNFIVPELVHHIEYRKGVFHPELGDFGSAGGAELSLVRSLPRPFFKFDIGEHRYRRAVGALQPLLRLAARPTRCLLVGASVRHRLLARSVLELHLPARGSRTGRS